MTTILSIQSSVAFGHVGNSAAAFALMRMGVETYPVYTVHYSNTTSYGSWRGPNLSSDQVMDVVTGVDERGALAGVDAVLSGFQGSVAMGATIVSAAELVKRRNPKALYCCDPVMGDVGRGMYVAAGIPEFLRDEVLPHADIATPNQYELNYLAGRDTHSLTDLRAAIDLVIAQGPRVVLVTSAMADDMSADSISMVAATSNEAWLVSTPRIHQDFTGSGDVTAAVFLARYLQTSDIGTALQDTASVVFSLLDATARAGSRELTLVADQDQIVHPRHTFAVTRLPD
ncbi:MAG: pyridoxal kinase PdxY [Propionibacteriaceae bacterium]|nr:pyridoxal kinase PdxY [Propionibacteriaceae bacterium]